MKTREPSRTGNGARLQEIVEAAAAAFHDHGYEATSMQDIADRVGMLKGSLYHHISSKEELLAAVLRDTQAGGLDIVDRHRNTQGSCRERLRSFVGEYTLYCIDNRMRAAIFDREFRSLTPARRRELIATRDRFDRFMRSLLHDGMQSREFSPDLDVVVTSNTIFSMMNTIYRWYSPSGKTSRTVLAEHVSELVDRMVAERPDRG
jgi:AcrR family transcriptional regulator